MSWFNKKSDEYRVLDKEGYEQVVIFHGDINNFDKTYAQSLLNNNGKLDHSFSDFLSSQELYDKKEYIFSFLKGEGYTIKSLVDEFIENKEIDPSLDYEIRYTDIILRVSDKELDKVIASGIAYAWILIDSKYKLYAKLDRVFYSDRTDVKLENKFRLILKAEK